MGQQFVSSIFFLQLTEGVDAVVLWCCTRTAWRDASSFWGQGVWSVGKKDADYLRAKGRCYWNHNLDDTGIPPGQVLASVLLGHHGEMETRWYGEKVNYWNIDGAQCKSGDGVCGQGTLGSKRPGTWTKACCNRKWLEQSALEGSKSLWENEFLL